MDNRNYRKTLRKSLSYNNRNRTKKAESSSSILYDHQTMKYISLEGNGDGKMIPNFKIINRPSNATVVINLGNNQEVYDQKGAVNYADSTIKVNTKTGGVMKALFRSLLTSQSFFMTYYTGTRDKLSTVAFSSPLSGDMFAVRIKPGSRYLISSDCFVCATGNVKLKTESRFKNILQDESVFLSVASVEQTINASDGMIWISSFGGYERLVIPDGESIKVEHGLFCLSDANLNYSISKLGGLKTFFLGDSGFFMTYKGPCELYVNNRNLNQYLHFIEKRMDIKAK
jgi:uncharacterized protein (TIGR00266 family)